MQSTILGLASSHALEAALAKYLEENPKIFRHCQSMNTGKPSHNESILDNNGNKSESHFFDVETFTQGSNNGKYNISRASGVCVSFDQETGKYKIYGNTYDSLGIESSNKLAEIINNSPIRDDFIRMMIQTPVRYYDGNGANPVYATFLHDVKVLFVSQNEDMLKKKEILNKFNIYYDEKGFNCDWLYLKGDSQSGYSKLSSEWMIDPEKRYEYCDLFNEWLESCLKRENMIKISVQAIATDPGPGYIHEKDGKTIYDFKTHQDADDWFVLWLINSLENLSSVEVVISDEMVYFDEDQQKYIGIREEFLKEEFPNINIIDSKVSHIDGFDMKSLSGFYRDRIKMTKHGPIIHRKEFSHYSPFLGIFDKLVDGRYTLVDKEKRRNGFEEDQIEAYKKFMESADLVHFDMESMSAENTEYLYKLGIGEKFVRKVLSSFNFIISRNKSGRGGTEANNGEAGSLYDIDGKTEMYTENGSISYDHQFVLIDNPILWWCNSSFFGQGPGIYGPEGTLVMLLKMKELCYYWGLKNDCSKSTMLGFHEHPDNSISSLHGHLLNLKRIKREDGEKGNLPGYEKHFGKTKSVDYYIEEMINKIDNRKDNSPFVYLAIACFVIPVMSFVYQLW